MEETLFPSLTDDIILNIFWILEHDPRDWARLACVCTRFSSLVRHSCWKNKCSQVFPSLAADLVSDSPSRPSATWSSLLKLAVCCPGLLHAGVPAAASNRSHLACGDWSLRREQGSKLLARQFRDDCLYICDWPGCVHLEEKRNYRLFRGVFKNFRESRVWRSVNDEKRRKVDIGCAFCACRQTWDLLSAFCLRRSFGYHQDGEPVVRAFVCENGHVSGAWTDVPISQRLELDFCAVVSACLVCGFQYCGLPLDSKEAFNYHDICSGIAFLLLLHEDVITVNSEDVYPGRNFIFGQDWRVVTNVAELSSTCITKIVELEVSSCIALSS
ncbi:hypothetical protein RJT34_22754 [Clitoria ternatea]|uniref:F-box domain-containing protein n=1 Tax=Clitoria ternatea TaxID=43366 RepID=A0AAN9FJX1_CLITE